MKVKKGIIWCLIFIGLLSLVSCGEAEEVNIDDNNIRVGFSMATLLEDRWLRDRDIFISKAQQRDIDVIIKNANRDSDLQYQQVLELIDQGIDVLVIAPNDTDQEAQCVEAAKANGIPVVAYDRLIRNASVDVYISFDNNMVGQLMAEYLLGVAPTGGYLLVNGPQTDYNCIMIRDGYMEVLQPEIDAGNVTIVDETWAEGWVRENAYDFVIANISQYRDELAAAICDNDSLAWGVADAFSEAMVEDIPIVGMDADLSACQRIISGRQDMTIYKPIQDLVTETLDACEKLAAGLPLEADRSIFDGIDDIPYIAIQVYAVTAKNMRETIIADGFHLEEDVYGIGQ